MGWFQKTLIHVVSPTADWLDHLRHCLHWLCLMDTYIEFGSWCCWKQSSLYTTLGIQFIIFWPVWFMCLFSTAFVLISETINPSKSWSCNVNCQLHWFAIGMRVCFNHLQKFWFALEWQPFLFYHWNPPIKNTL